MDALNPTGYGVVLVTVASQSEATAIATILIEEKLAACINVFPVQSIYQWEGNIQQESEFQLIIKTNLQNYPAEFKKFIPTKSLKLSPYRLCRVQNPIWVG
jgi:uncharacterized protein involved in tolerance to divalent cations